MLTTPLTHPRLLAALAVAGHGSRILISDGNYPHSTGRRPGTTLIHLNLAPGLLDVTQILTPMVAVTEFEAATVMRRDDGAPVPAHADYVGILGPDIPFETLDRYDFYEAVRSDDIALVIASGDQRSYANLLLTVGFIGVV